MLLIMAITLVHLPSQRLSHHLPVFRELSEVTSQLEPTLRMVVVVAGLYFLSCCDRLVIVHIRI